MYLIVNTTKRKIILSDIAIQIQAGQMIDLDNNKKTSILPQHSKDLIQAQKAGIISIVKNDRNKVEIKKQQVKKQPQPQPQIDMAAFLKALKQQIKSAVAQQTISAKKQSSNNQVLQAIKNLSSKVNNSNSGQIQQQTMDSELSQQIHAKAIDKIKKNTSGSIQYKKQIVNEQNLQSNLDDLENIM